MWPGDNGIQTTTTTTGHEGGRISKSSGKKVLHLVLIMVLTTYLDGCDGFSECSGACVSPIVAKLGLYNTRAKDTGGYLRVNRSSVIADAENRFTYLYKISAHNGSFYLYDPNSKKFICWNKNYTVPVARRYKPSDSMHLCAFKDSVSAISRHTHIELHHRSNPQAKLQFNHRGRFATRRSVARCEKRKRTRVGGGRQQRRHQHRCSSAEFLSTPVCEAACADPHAQLCCGELRALQRMRELRPVCWRYRCQSDGTA